MVLGTDAHKLHGVYSALHPDKVKPNYIPYNLFATTSTPANKTTETVFRGTGLEPQAIKAELALGKNYKDDVVHVGCFNSFMGCRGDKFGGSKFSYEIGSISNVSILFLLFLLCCFGIMLGRKCCSAEGNALDDCICPDVTEGDLNATPGCRTMKSCIFQMNQCYGTFETHFPATLFEPDYQMTSSTFTSVETPPRSLRLPPHLN